MRLATMGCFRIYVIDSRFLTSTTRSYETRVLSSLEKWAGKAGYFPLTIYTDKKCMLDPSKGGLRAHISYSMTPRDQISLLKE